MMSENSCPLLAFDRVSFGYRPAVKPVLRELSAAIEPGTVTAVLGPNGAGKTTFLHVALGWLVPWSGRVIFEGQPLARYSRRQLGRSMAIVPQIERIPFEYSVLEYIALGRAPYLAPLDLPGREDIRICLEALAEVGIEALAGRGIMTLSAGERQMATIARALAQRPRLLILDEPTSHLDLANKARTLGLIKDLSSRGATILFSTHDPESAEAVATHLILMRDGRIKETGPLDRVLNSESLSETYGLPVTIIDVAGKRIATWSPIRGSQSSNDRGGA